MDIPAERLLAPEAALFAHFRRHRLHRMEGKLDEPEVQAQIIAKFKADQTVLVCANTVKGAQQILQTLRQKLESEGLDPQKTLLLHSRFTGIDRQHKEERIRAEVSADKPKKDPLIVVATQVIEVSLDWISIRLLPSLPR